MELMVISDPGVITHEARLINQLFEAGLTRLHLRKPDWNDQQLVNLLKQIDQAFYPFIAVHQYHYIAVDFNITRLHYTEKHRLTTGEDKLILQKQEGYTLSTSIHTNKDLRSFENFVSLDGYRIENSPFLFDYTFFGPVFNSISKPGYPSTLTEDFRISRNNTQPKVIALGGVKYSNLDKLEPMGFDGAAVLGTIWNDSAQAITNFKKLQEYLLIKQT